MLDWILNTDLLLQALFEPLVSAKYFTSFKKAFTVEIPGKNIILQKFIKKIWEKMEILLF